jgi:signal transduction histidine kinase
MKEKIQFENGEFIVEPNRLRPQTFVWITTGISILTLTGWITNVRFLSGQWGSYIPMASITAIVCLLQGFTLLLCIKLPGKRISRDIALAAVSIISILSLLVLIEFIAGIKLSVEELLSTSTNSLNQVPVGRMSPLTAVSLLLLNVSILILIIVQQRNRTTTSAAMFALGAAAINFVVIAGYIFGTPLLYGGKNVPTSMFTAVALLAEGTGLFLMAVPHSLVLRSWSSNSFKGRLLRAFLFPIVGIVLVETWVETRIELHNPGNLLLFHALLALVFVAVTVIIIGLTSRRMGKSIEESRMQILKLARFIEESPGPVLRFMRDGRLSYANSVSKQLLEYLHCKNPGDFLPEAERRLINEDLEKAVNKRIEVKCGELIYSLLIVPVPELEYVNIYAEDITERKRAEIIIQQQNIQLKELNANKDKFFSIIAHDLKSPFLGFLGLTQEIAQNADKYSVQWLTRIGSSLNKSADNLFKLLHNLLEWSQMQNGSIRLERKKIDLSELIAKNLEVVKSASEHKSIFINNLSKKYFVFADETMVDSVLLNLISNAVKFTSQSGTITIGTNIKEDRMIEIYIRDTGVGMPNDLIEKLFKIGEKTGRKGTDGELSTGLGLLLCKEFIEKNGGNIRVESKEGNGSTFYFTLPTRE